MAGIKRDRSHIVEQSKKIDWDDFDFEAEGLEEEDESVLINLIRVTWTHDMIKAISFLQITDPEDLLDPELWKEWDYDQKYWISRLNNRPLITIKEWCRIARNNSQFCLENGEDVYARHNGFYRFSEKTGIYEVDKGCAVPSVVSAEKEESSRIAFTSVIVGETKPKFKDGKFTVKKKRVIPLFRDLSLPIEELPFATMYFIKSKKSNNFIFVGKALCKKYSETLNFDMGVDAAVNIFHLDVPNRSLNRIKVPTPGMWTTSPKDYVLNMSQVKRASMIWNCAVVSKWAHEMHIVKTLALPFIAGETASHLLQWIGPTYKLSVYTSKFVRYDKRNKGIELNLVDHFKGLGRVFLHDVTPEHGIDEPFGFSFPCSTVGDMDRALGAVKRTYSNFFDGKKCFVAISGGESSKIWFIKSESGISEETAIRTWKFAHIVSRRLTWWNASRKDGPPISYLYAQEDGFHPVMYEAQIRFLHVGLSTAPITLPDYPAPFALAAAHVYDPFDDAVYDNHGDSDMDHSDED